MSEFKVNATFVFQPEGNYRDKTDYLVSFFFYSKTVGMILVASKIFENIDNLIVVFRGHQPKRLKTLC